MAFDHAEIRDYTRFIETGVRPSPVTDRLVPP